MSRVSPQVPELSPDWLQYVSIGRPEVTGKGVLSEVTEVVDGFVSGAVFEKLYLK